MSELSFAAASGSGFFTGRTETDGGSLPSGSGRNADRLRTGRAWQTIATSSSCDLVAEVQLARGTRHGLRAAVSPRGSGGRAAHASGRGTTARVPGLTP